MNKARDAADIAWSENKLLRDQLRDLQRRGGDDNGGSMEARLARLEAHVENMRGEISKLGPVPTDLAILKTRVDHLPSKGFIVSSAITTVAAIVGLLTLLSKFGLLTVG